MASKRNDADARYYRRHGCMQFHPMFELTWKPNEKSPAIETLNGTRACSQDIQRHQVRRHAVPSFLSAVDSSALLLNDSTELVLSFTYTLCEYT